MMEDKNDWPMASTDLGQYYDNRGICTWKLIQQDELEETMKQPAQLWPGHIALAIN